MTPEQVASTLRSCHGMADDTSIDLGALLALAGIATEYVAATDAWNAASYGDAELLGAATRLEHADRELRTALGLPDGDAPLEPELAFGDAPPDSQTTFEFSDRVVPVDQRTTR